MDDNGNNFFIIFTICSDKHIREGENFEWTGWDWESPLLSSIILVILKSGENQIFLPYQNTYFFIEIG